MKNLINCFRKAVFILFGIVILLLILMKGIIVYEAKNYEEKKVDYIITLGAGLYGTTPSQSLLERLHTTLEYAEKYKDTKIIVCGGQGKGEDITEAEAMEYFLLDKGISKDRILKEDKSTSTFENLRNAKNIIGKFNDDKSIDAVIVTSDFHIFRSKLIAKRLGFDPVGLPAKTPMASMPKSYLREYFAIIKSILLDKE